MGLCSARAGRRSGTVVETEHWLAVAPYRAAWPFERYCCPKPTFCGSPIRPTPSAAISALALKKLTSRYDTSSSVLPYSYGLACAPFNGERINTGSCT
ncbi:hypothetical protein ACNKHL_03200 [Shigella flexneri]